MLFYCCSANEKLKEGEKFLSEMRQQLQETQEKYVAEQARAQDRISDMEQKYTTALSRAESAEVGDGNNLCNI